MEKMRSQTCGDSRDMCFEILNIEPPTKIGTWFDHWSQASEQNQKQATKKSAFNGTPYLSDTPRPWPWLSTASDGNTAVAHGDVCRKRFLLCSFRKGVRSCQRKGSACPSIFQRNVAINDFDIQNHAAEAAAVEQIEIHVSVVPCSRKSPAVLF